MRFFWLEEPYLPHVEIFSQLHFSAHPSVGAGVIVLALFVFRIIPFLG